MNRVCRSLVTTKLSDVFTLKNIEKVNAIPYWDRTTGTIVLLFHSCEEKDEFLRRNKEDENCGNN